MNTKKGIGYSFIILGVVLIAFGLNRMYEIIQHKKTTYNMTVPFSKKPVEVTVGESPEHQTPDYDQQSLWSLVGGVVLLGIGGVVLFRKK